MTSKIQLSYLDHVAIRVADMERSAAWYAQTLDMERYSFKEWGPFPIFMLAAKKYGVALFPLRGTQQSEAQQPLENMAFIDHFAFHVDEDNFEKARMRYEELSIPYQIKNHHFFESIYVTDPDGHTVELTRWIVSPSDFFQANL